MSNRDAQIRRRASWIGAGILGLGFVAICSLAVWAFAGPMLRWNLRMTASGMRARIVDAGLRVRDPFGDEPAVSCNCSSNWEYRCSDPSSAYVQRIRRDPRLAPLFEAPAHRLETHVRHQDFLRDQFASGDPSHPPRAGYNILEKLDDAAAGSPFRCNDAARMFVELVQANGGFARVVALVDPDGSGHVVTEAWVADPGKWVVFDPLYDIYYTGPGGTLLSALDLHEIHRSGRYEIAVAHKGPSANSEYRPERHVYLLRHYDSIAFARRADFDTRYPLWHPKEHAVDSLSAWVTGRAGFWAPGVRDTISEVSQLYFTPCRKGQGVASSNHE